MTDILLTAARLDAALGSDRPPVVLDVRSVSGRADRDSYLAGHLPGAVFLDLDADLAAPPGAGGRHPLPAPEDLQRSWRRAGISDGSPIVVYDAKDASIAARAWWLLRWSGVPAADIQVLDGGFAAWERNGSTVEAGGGRVPRPGSIVVRPGGMPSVSADEAAELASGHGVLLDARAAARYRGEIEPLDRIAGHIPGAVNLPLTDLLTSGGTFREPAELEVLFEEVVPDQSTTVAASCGSGVTACHFVLAGALIDRQLALYPGSYSGWLALGRDVVVGAEPMGLPVKTRAGGPRR